MFAQTISTIKKVLAREPLPSVWEVRLGCEKNPENYRLHLSTRGYDVGTGTAGWLLLEPEMLKHTGYSGIVVEALSGADLGLTTKEVTQQELSVRARERGYKLCPLEVVVAFPCQHKLGDGRIYVSVESNEGCLAMFVIGQDPFDGRKKIHGHLDIEDTDSYSRHQNFLFVRP